MRKAAKRRRMGRKRSITVAPSTMNTARSTAAPRMPYSSTRASYALGTLK